MVTGTIAGLATVTPASGFVGPMAGVLLGLTGGAVCYIAVDLVKHKWKIDDSLDVLAVHGVGGALGSLMVALLAGLPGGTGLGETSAGSQFSVQLLGVGAVLVWSVIATTIIVLITRALVGLRVSQDEEIEGLDFSTHGESGYRF